MGSISFLLPDHLSAAADAALRKASLAGGYDQNPQPTRVQIQDHRLIASRDVNESGYLLVPWPVDPFGNVVSTTTTLRERPESYNLLVELARGKLNQLRCQTVEWQALGLRTPDDFQREFKDVSSRFAKAVLSQSPAESDPHAAHVIGKSYELADRLVRIYTTQVFETRHQDEGKLPARFAARLTKPPAGELLNEYRQTFNAVAMPIRWRDVEPVESQYDWTATDQIVAMAKAANLPVTGGPVIDLAPGMIPGWAAGWEGDLPTLAAFMCDFLETVLNRYKSQVRRWQVCSGFNHADAYGLTDDDRLRLAARLFEAAAQVDPNIELVLGIAQPWGDYLVNEDQTIPPFQFADDMVRSGLRLSSAELEIRVGSAPRSAPRDLLETCRILDMFGLLGLPLEVLLSCPSASGPDPIAAIHNQTTTDFPGRSGPTPDGQAEWGMSSAALALCKPHVRAVTWDHWSDADPHLSPNCGLCQSDNRPKPVLARLRSLRAAHLA